jgi:ribokinase
LQLVDVLTPNQTEANVLTGRSPDASSDAEEVAQELIRAGVKQVVMTLGERGALIVNASSCKHVPAPEMRAVDTTGAGDAFNAGLATAMANGENLESAVRFAVIAGALAVTKEGVIPSLPRRQEVADYLCEHSQKAPLWLMGNAISTKTESPNA